jgi:hypothetical protein
MAEFARRKLDQDSAPPSAAIYATANDAARPHTYAFFATNSIRIDAAKTFAEKNERGFLPTPPS